MQGAMDREGDRRDRLTVITNSSLSIALLQGIAGRIADSRLAALARWSTNATRHSFLFHWLTKEPEPEVIVIDLRDTYTIGPAIAVLDRLVATLGPGWHTSRLKQFTGGVAAVVESAAQTKTGRIVTKLIEPPDPPEDDQ